MNWSTAEKGIESVKPFAELKGVIMGEISTAEIGLWEVFRPVEDTPQADFIHALNKRRATVLLESKVNAAISDLEEILVGGGEREVGKEGFEPRTNNR